MLFLALTAVGCNAPTEPLRAEVPTLGWNSWNVYGCGVTEADVRTQADALIDSGLAAAGYRTVIVDDCWYSPQRTTTGDLRADPVRFPSGMATLGEYLHSRGLRFGLYASPGTQTCAQLTGTYPGRTGSIGHEERDARAFAAWGVDYLKYDWCGPGVGQAAQFTAFATMHDALARTGRDITYAINPNSGVADSVPGAHADFTGIADSVRATNDVVPAWRIGHGPYASQGITDVLEAVPARIGAPVRDLDMLVAGLPGVSAAEARTQIMTWAMLGSPLLLGSDLTTLPRDIVALLEDPVVTALATGQSAPAEVGAGELRRDLPNGRMASTVTDPLTHATTLTVRRAIASPRRPLRHWS